MSELAELTRRVERIEAIHDTGGACNVNRSKIWEAVNKLGERVTALEVKLLIGGAVISIAGPLIAQWIFKRFGG